MSLFRKVHDKLFVDEGNIPPPPAPGHAVPKMPAYDEAAPRIDEHQIRERPMRSEGFPQGLMSAQDNIKEHPAHDTPFFTQKPREEQTNVPVVPTYNPPAKQTQKRAEELMPAQEPAEKPESAEPAQDPVEEPMPAQKEPAKPPMPVQDPVEEPMPAQKEPAAPTEDSAEVPKKDPVDESMPTQRVDTPKKEPSQVTQPPTFHLCDGRVIAGPTSLAFVAEDMTDDVFSHHVTKEKNDFATWIEQGLNDTELAARVRTATNPQELHSVLTSRKTVSEETHMPLPELPEPFSTLKESLDKVREELDQASKAREDIEAQKTALEEQENDLRNRQEQFARTLEEFEKEREHTRHILEETARLRDELRKRHVELAELALTLDAEQDRLKATSQRRTQLSQDVREDTFEKMALQPSGPADDIHHILEAVENAHRSLVNNQIAQARALYSQARELFYQAHMPEEERRELYNLIRELYTDIELTRMG